jgi:hypothetical protein
LTFSQIQLTWFVEPTFEDRALARKRGKNIMFAVWRPLLIRRRALLCAAPALAMACSPAAYVADTVLSLAFRNLGSKT